MFFSGITRLNLDGDKEVHLIQVTNGKKVKTDDELMLIKDRSILKILTQELEPKVDFSKMQLDPQQVQIIKIFKSLLLAMDNIQDIRGNDLKLLSDFTGDDIKNYSKWFDEGFVKQAVSLANGALKHRQKIKDIIIINNAIR